MITGVVTGDRDAVLTFRVRGPAGNECDITALIDTGFDGMLSLPRALVTSLGLIYRQQGRALLADGRESLFDIYEARLLWEGCWRRVSVDETGTWPLVGTALLDGNELKIQFQIDGAVTVSPLLKGI